MGKYHQKLFTLSREWTIMIYYRYIQTMWHTWIITTHNYTDRWR